MKLISIPNDKYDDYRLDVIFKGYKWDPQFADHNTIAKRALVISERESAELVRLTEDLDNETIRAEHALIDDLKLTKPLGLPRSLRKELPRMKNYQADKHVRLARYDFHPVTGGGWAVSEVNSDVPGGFAEASLMPRFAARALGGEDYWYMNFGDTLADAIAAKVKPGGSVVMTHCTSYSDDRQVMQFIGDKLESMGFKIIYAAADHLRFANHKAMSVLDGNRREVDGIFRFTPLEWLKDMKPKRWQGYFDTTTPSCNHPVSIFAQSKRFPFVWESLEKLGISLYAWRRLLPLTRRVKDAKNEVGFIYKPVYGRTGEGIAIKEACSEDEYKKIIRDVKRRPDKYIAQKRFDSQPLISDEGGSYHVCLGSYAVEGKAAGFYARINAAPRIDSGAADIPVLIERGGDDRSGADKGGADTRGTDRGEAGINDIGGNGVDSGRVDTGGVGWRGADGCGIERGAAGINNIGGSGADNVSVDTGSVCGSGVDSGDVDTGGVGRSKEAFKAWAPVGARWVDWVRPVPFIALDQPDQAGFVANYSIPDIQYIGKLENDTAVFLDLPGYDSVMEGLGLATLGWRPIPLYNGVNPQKGARALVDNHSIAGALAWGALALKKLKISADAPPVFLLDSNRAIRHRVNESIFDNSWDIYSQDVPSAGYLLSNGITRVIARGQTPPGRLTRAGVKRGSAIQRDLAGILLEYQKKGIAILFTDGYEKAKEVSIKKPLREYLDSWIF